MSALSPKEHIDPQDPLYYAPKWLRERPVREPLTELPPAAPPPPATTGSPAQGSAFEPSPRFDSQFEDAVAKALQQPIEAMDYTPEHTEKRPLIGIVARFGAAIAVAGCVALFYVMLVSGPKDKPEEGSGGPLSGLLQSVATVASTAPQAGIEPSLLVKDGSGDANEPLPLGINVTALTPGATVTLIGLPNGARLSPGSRASSGEWLISVSDLPVATVIPPPDYVGAMNIAAELRGANGKAISRSPVQLIWNQAVAAAPAAPVAAAPRKMAAAPPPPPPAAESQPALRQIPPEEIAALVRRGEELARSGDLAAARLLLQRAAEARNARAAFVLAATYDPIIIEKIATNSPMANVELARIWYQRALDWGSAEAPKQLEALASMRR